MGQRLPPWVNTVFYEYARRLPPHCALHLTEIPLIKRTKSTDLERLHHQESKRMLAAIANEAYVIALDEQGHMWNSVQLSKQLAQWMQKQTNIALLVGGPEGLSTACLQRAQQQWSLSALTLPHALVRVIVAEQLYRAWSLLHHHPYHRG
jgi:23S rRNA (pseudouridine1915-N3)-methyltransferase